MQFSNRTEVLKPWTVCNFGDQISVDIPREFHLENLYIRFEITAGGTPPVLTANKEGWRAICDEIRLDVLSGATQRSPIRTTSSGAIEWWRANGGALDRQTLYQIDTSLTTSWTAGDINYLTIPISTVPPALDDPAASLFLLPLPRFSANPQLRFNITAGANIITVPANATLRYKVLMQRRFVNVDTFPTFETEQNFLDIAYAAAGDAQSLEIPLPGTYLGFLGQTYDVTDFRTPVSTYKAKGYTQATGAGNTGGLAWSQVEKLVELKFLNNVIRRASLDDLQVINDYSQEKFPAATQPNTGSTSSNAWFMDFLSDKFGSTAQDFGSTLDVNPLVGQGARANLYLSPTLPGGSKLRLHYVRVFGDTSPLRRSLVAAKKK